MTKHTLFLSLIFILSICSCNEQADKNNPLNQQDENNDITQIKDFDGNVYSTVLIDNQLWLSENIKTTHFINGDEIVEAKSAEVWLDCFRNGQPCYRRLGENIIYNGFVISDSRKLVSGKLLLPTKKEFDVLRNYLGKSADKKLASYDWEVMTDPDNSIKIKGNNKSGFSAKKSGNIRSIMNSKNDIQVFESTGNEYPAWYWTSTEKKSDFCGFKTPSFYSVMIGSYDAFSCDDPREGEANYAYGLQIRMVKYIDRAVEKKEFSSNNKKSITGIYIKSIANEFYEKLEGLEETAHWIDGEIIFDVDGKETSFFVHQDTEKDFLANDIKDFWVKKPKINLSGAHGKELDFTNQQNLGKRFKVYYKVDNTNNKTITHYELIDK